MHQLINNIKITSALDFLVTPASADREGAILDMANWEGVLVIVKFSAIEASSTLSIKMQSGDDSGLSDYADLLGTGVTVAADDDDQVKYIDLKRPLERYVRVVVDKDASHTSDECAIYIQYGPRKAPITQTSGAVEGEAHVSPAEGTA